jgi:hypothetical protein
MIRSQSDRTSSSAAASRPAPSPRQLIAALVGGSSPVLSDIVDLPCLSEVLTAVRFDLLDVDRLDHRFFPSRAARPEEVRSAVESLCHVLDLKPPVWCEEGGATAGCTLVVSEPVRGQQVAAMVSRLIEAERP